MAVKTQNHIHISTTLGGAPENSPDITWKAYRTQPNYQVFLSASRTLNGTLQVQYLADGGGDPKVFTDYVFEIKISNGMIGVAALLALAGKQVYFVDFYHPDDTEDHTSYVKTMRVARVAWGENIEPSLTHVRMTIQLLDEDT